MTSKLIDLGWGVVRLTPRAGKLEFCLMTPSTEDCCAESALASLDQAHVKALIAGLSEWVDSEPTLGKITFTKVQR